MSLLESLYNVAVNAVRPLLPAFGAASGKVSAAVEGRRFAAEDIARWGAQERDVFRPLLWLHGASAGELAGAVPVMEHVRRAVPELQLLVTYSSPSAIPVADELEAGYAGYPPLETVAACRAALDGTRPDALVFAKLDAWPALTRAAQEAGVRLGMINATVRPTSTRLRGPGRQLLAPSYGRLDAVGAVAPDERGRLELLGARPEAIRVTGDASFERALQRVEQARASVSVAPRLPPSPPGRVRLCVGSSWPEDERVVIQAAAAAATRDGTDIDLVLVPHEPDAGALRRIRRHCLDELGREPLLLSELEASPGGEATAPTGPILVDVVGLLAEIYLECDLAWVGGGVGTEGLHSVVEPAAAGLPVLFGPVHDRWEAREMVDLGVALEVTPSSAADVLSTLAADPARRARMGAEARAFVERGRGSAEANAGVVLELLGRSD